MLREAETIDLGAKDTKLRPAPGTPGGLEGNFTERLEVALRNADRGRRRHQITHRLASLVPFLLLAIPIVAWHLMSASPGGPHAVISSLAWVTFVLDVGVHTNQALLSYLGLQLVPSFVGALLLLLVTAWVLTHPGGEE